MEPAPIDQLKAMAHPRRFQILAVLKNGELSVGEIEKLSGIRQPMLSQQLSILRRAGLVNTRKCAKLVFYGRDEDRLAAVAEAVGSANTRSQPRQAVAPGHSTGAANFARLT